MRRRGGINISFLDVFCNAMGASIILAVLFSVVKNPVRIPLRGQFILMEMTVEGDVQGPGVSVTTPRNETVDFLPNYLWPEQLQATATDVRIWETISREGADDVTRVYFEVREPIAGLWELRPTMPRWSTTNGSSKLKFTRVRLWTRDGEIKGPAESDLRRPGEECPEPYRVRLSL